VIDEKLERKYVNVTNKPEAVTMQGSKFVMGAKIMALRPIKAGEQQFGDFGDGISRGLTDESSIYRRSPSSVVGVF